MGGETHYKKGASFNAPYRLIFLKDQHHIAGHQSQGHAKNSEVKPCMAMT